MKTEKNFHSKTGNYSCSKYDRKVNKGRVRAATRDALRRGDY